MPNNIGSVGKYIPIPPIWSCSKLRDIGVQKTTKRKSLSKAKRAAKPTNKMMGTKLRK